MYSSTRIARTATRLATTSLAALLVCVVSSAASAVTLWVIQPSQNPGGVSEPNTFAAVAATSSTNAWAVGSYRTPDTAANQTLIEHWNGSDWQVQDSPNPGGPPDSGHDDNYLLGVAATSDTRAWAVGNFNNGSAYQTLIERWNGTSWKVQTSSNPGGITHFNGLSAVAATSPSNVWAVGSYSDGLVEHSLIERWDGAAWKKIKSPSPGTNGTRLTGVAVTSLSNVWAVGTTNDGSVNKTLILHWDGLAWKRVPSPNPGGMFETDLLGVDAVSMSDAWAVGYFANASAYQTLVLHWDGLKWKRVASPNLGGSTFNNELFGVAATSSSNAWAVGTHYTGGPYETLVLHWTGTAWRHQTSPNPSTADNYLYGVAATSSSNAWAAGVAPNGTADQTLTLQCC